LRNEGNRRGRDRGRLHATQCTKSRRANGKQHEADPPQHTPVGVQQGHVPANSTDERGQFRNCPTATHPMPWTARPLELRPRQSAPWEWVVRPCPGNAVAPASVSHGGHAHKIQWRLGRKNHSATYTSPRIPRRTSSIWWIARTHWYHCTQPAHKMGTGPRAMARRCDGGEAFSYALDPSTMDGAPL